MKEQLFEPKRLKELSKKIKDKKSKKKTFLQKLLDKINL
jgi:hypothetical protein|tara:strand:- start:9672 stop:9788 length:117 start_codon:yes stop_codon:yes gene_type:complete